MWHECICGICFGTGLRYDISVTAQPCVQRLWYLPGCRRLFTCRSKLSHILVGDQQLIGDDNSV